LYEGKKGLAEEMLGELLEELEEKEKKSSSR
jgi:hypothetical protein